MGRLRPYGAGANRRSAWTALACGAALMSDGNSQRGAALLTGVKGT